MPVLIRVSDGKSSRDRQARSGAIQMAEGGAAMRTVAEWLASIGLRQYGERFAERAIELMAIRDLTDRDLAELGVLPEHRRKMRRAIAALYAAPLAPGATATEAGARDQAERRQLTVMFCDLVGASALAARLEPQDMERMIA